MTFHRKKDPIVFQYQIEGIPIDRVFEIRDHGVLYDVKLSTVLHIDYIISKDLLILVFAMRICFERSISINKFIFCGCQKPP